MSATDHPSISRLEPPPLEADLIASVLESLAERVLDPASDQWLAEFVRNFALTGTPDTVDVGTSGNGFRPSGQA